MAELKASKVIMVVPLLSFLALCLVYQQNGKEGPWHERCVTFWKQQQWQEITALASNLKAIGKPDTEAYFLATLASVQKSNSSETASFANSLLDRKFLNFHMERELAFQYEPGGWKEFARLHRSRVTAVLIGLLAILSLLAMRWKAAAAWITAVSLAGCAVLLL